MTRTRCRKDLLLDQGGSAPRKPGCPVFAAFAVLAQGRARAFLLEGEKSSPSRKERVLFRFRVRPVARLSASSALRRPLPAGRPGFRKQNIFDGKHVGPIVWSTSVAHMWSIGIKLVFYILAPFVAGRPKWLLVLLVAAYATHIYLISKLDGHAPLRLRSALRV